MNRKDFLKRLGIGLGVAVVAPSVIAEVNPPEEEKYATIEDINMPLYYEHASNLQGILDREGFLYDKIKFNPTTLKRGDTFYSPKYSEGIRIVGYKIEGEETLVIVTKA